jgi:VanZ family protein
MKRVWLVICLIACSFSLYAQSPTSDSQLPTSFFTPSPTLNKQRLHLVTYSAIGLYPATMSWFYTQWYSDYSQTNFHLFNDEAEWQQMDKCGHIMSAYSIGKPLFRIFQWTGMNDTKSVLYGAGIAYLYQSTIEMFDGFSSEWGFSLSDVGANTLGSAILISQQLLWNQQRIVLKESFHQTKYSAYRPNVLGKDLAENILKDYNGQTYWASVNVFSFLQNKESKFPKWLSVAVGYGAEGMVGARTNPSEVDGKVVPSFQQYRQYYLGLDFELSRLETKSKFLNGFFKVINIVRLPAPAVEFNQDRGTKFYWLYF